MDTYEARVAMRDLAGDALQIVERVAAGTSLTAADKRDLRGLAGEARTILSDAGYPGEATWRVLQRSSLGADTSGDHTDALFWQDIVEELGAALETLDQLVSSTSARQSHIHIVS